MEKSLPTWLSQFSFAKLRKKQSRLFSLPSQRISFKPKEAIDEFFWKTQRKIWYSILRVDAMPLSLKNLLLNDLNFCQHRLGKQVTFTVNDCVWSDDAKWCRISLDYFELDCSHATTDNKCVMFMDWSVSLKKKIMKLEKNTYLF